MQEEELTTEERIKWLRERGIQVHIPNEKPETNDSEIEEICVVKIPHDERLPFEEVLLKLRSDKAGDQCLDLLKDYFRSDNTYDDLDKELLNNINKELGDFNIKSSTINKQLQSGGTEAFTLMYPCQENHFTRVIAYLDEAGQLKRLPRNNRASSIATLCGFDNVPFCGDIFIGRSVVGGYGNKGTNVGPIRNINFNIKDASSDSEWMKQAHHLNYQYGLKTNRVRMDTDLPDDSDVTPEKLVAVHEDQLPYRWNQSSDSLEISLTLPGEIASRDLNVSITSNKISVGQKSTGKRFLDITLKHRIIPSDCTWTLAQGNLELSLEKANKNTWSQLEASE